MLTVPDQWKAVDYAVHQGKWGTQEGTNLHVFHFSGLSVLASNWLLQLKYMYVYGQQPQQRRQATQTTCPNMSSHLIRRYSKLCQFHSKMSSSRENKRRGPGCACQKFGIQSKIRAKGGSLFASHWEEMFLLCYQPALEKPHFNQLFVLV